MNGAYFWLVAGLLLLLAELFTPGFVVCCFGIGALMACVASFLGAGLFWQVFCFAVGSFATLFLLRPLLNRGLRKRKLAGKLHPATDKDGSLPTGMDALKGRSALVVKEIDGIEGIGRVAIDGDEWPAKAATSEEKFNVGERIIVTDNESIVLVVAPYPEAQSNTTEN